MRILEKENYFYVLEFDEKSNKYFLEVVCGRIAVFDLRIKLTDQKIADYRKHPESIKNLAQKISDSPDRYIYRRVTVN